MKIRTFNIQKKVTFYRLKNSKLEKKTIEISHKFYLIHQFESLGFDEAVKFQSLKDVNYLEYLRSGKSDDPSFIRNLKIYLDTILKNLM